MADTTVLVTGATGTVSTALLAALKGKPGIKVRAPAVGGVPDGCRSRWGAGHLGVGAD